MSTRNEAWHMSKIARQAAACWTSEDRHAAWIAYRAMGLPWLYHRAKSVVVHDRVMRLCDGQPVAQEIINSSDTTGAAP